MNQRIYLNNDWYFTEDWSRLDDDGLQKVRIPHTCKELPYHYFSDQDYQMVSGYRRTLDVPEEWRGKNLLLTFDGAAHQATVYINGVEAASHYCGYTSFTMDISRMVKYGQVNEITVKLDSRESLNIPPFGFVIDYMTYGGIYRDVYLDIKQQTYIRDIFIHADIDAKADSKARVISEIELAGATPGGSRSLKIRQSISPHNAASYTTLGESSAKAAVLDFPAEDIQLWSPDSPALYDIKTELLFTGREEPVDSVVTTIGFRSAQFRRDGFYLNGEKLRIRGLNRHQSYPYVGYAMPDEIQKRDADILKYELGLNAVRTSHYPQSQAFIDRCDEVGLLVFTEIPGWQHIGDAAWKEQAVANVKDMILQYRNHPSIILWGVRINESMDDDELYSKTNSMAHALDPTRQTGGVRYIKKSSLLEDVYTYNDFSHTGDNSGCEKKSSVTSDKSRAYLISEYNGHMYPTKSFDSEEHRLGHALRHANVLEDASAESDIAGTFGWCMFDYNTHKDFGSGDRICHHGVMDMFRNPKLAAAVYASQQDETPVLEISSSMDIGEHPGGNRGDIYIFTNADSIRMYRNGEFIKEYVPDRSRGSRYRHLQHPPILVDDFIGDALESSENMPHNQAAALRGLLNEIARFGLNDLPKASYAKAMRLLLKYRMSVSEATELYTKYIGGWGGESTVYEFAAIKDGAEVKRISRGPVGEKHLHVEADRTSLAEGKSYDAAAVRIRMVDEYGNTLHFANDPVILKAEGSVELIGPAVISLQGGMGGTYVRTIGEIGEGRLIITTPEGLKEEIVFSVSRADQI